jgi:hypothetical protein
MYTKTIASCTLLNLSDNDYKVLSKSLVKTAGCTLNQEPWCCHNLAAACCAMALLAPGACCSSVHVLLVVALAGLRAVPKQQHHKGKGIAKHLMHGTGKRAVNYTAARTAATPSALRCAWHAGNVVGVHPCSWTSSAPVDNWLTNTHICMMHPLPAQPLPVCHAGAQEHSALPCLHKQCRRRALGISIAAWLCRCLRLCCGSAAAVVVCAAHPSAAPHCGCSMAL